MLAAARSKNERRRLAHLSLAAVLLLAAAAAAVLCRFPPAVYGFYPLCPVHEYLHLECPGCGSTRALAALLHGHLGEALRLNALFVAVVLPGVLCWGAVMYVRGIRGGEFRWPQVPGAAVYAGFGVVAAFTFLRNF